MNLAKYVVSRLCITFWARGGYQARVWAAFDLDLSGGYGLITFFILAVTYQVPTYVIQSLIRFLSHQKHPLQVFVLLKL